MWRKEGGNTVRIVRIGRDGGIVGEICGRSCGRYAGGGSVPIRQGLLALRDQDGRRAGPLHEVRRAQVDRGWGALVMRPRVPAAVRSLFHLAFGRRRRSHRFSVRCGGTIRLPYRPSGELYDWELTFLVEEADAIAAWVRSGAVGPLPVLEYIERRWNPDYRWTAAAWRTSRSDPRCWRGAPTSEKNPAAAPVEILDEDALTLVCVDTLGETPVRPAVVAALRARVTRAIKRGGAPHGTSRKRTG